MSFTKTKKLMEEGDTVLLYLGYDNLVPIQLARGRVHQNRFGAVKHERLIGAPYGVKVDCPKGWLYPLQASAELWTLALPHRTQILYTPDISMIVLQLDLKPGAVVVEAGTGSGSLSHALLRSVQPSGRLHTFEFHAERCAAAKKEFEEHGLGACVTAEHRDVCADGFGEVRDADAVFLDLPSPWECIGHARKALKSGGRLCSFSPCVEQVQRTCEALRGQGFSDLTTLECLARPFAVQKVTLPSVDFGDWPQPQPPSAIALPTEQGESVAQEEDGASQEGGVSKQPRMMCRGVEDDAVKDAEDTKVTPASSNGAGTAQREVKGREAKGREFRTGAPPQVMQGHTGFLTFATLY